MLIDYCTTEKQRAVVEAIEEHGTIKAAASALGIAFSTAHAHYGRVKKRAALQDPGMHDYSRNPVPDPYLINGVSMLVPKTETTPMHWVKSRLSREQLEKQLQEAVRSFYETAERVAPTIVPDNVEWQTDVIPWFQIGDAHLGMLAHEAEVGHNFDVKIATTELLSAFAILFDECAPGERCVINDLGDFTHYENFAGETEASRHKLDYDGRFPKMVHAYPKIMRGIIDMALTKFKHVDIIINQGNHSRTNDIWMAELLRNVYELESRVHVLNNSNVFTPYRMGNTFILTHHGDKCRVGNLPAVMATDYPTEWGACEHRYIDTGHIHHRLVSKEHPGVVVESFNTLAPGDKYAHDGGWRSRQSITRIDRHRRYGEVGRRRLPIEEIRDRIREGLTKHVKDGYKTTPAKAVYSV